MVHCVEGTQGIQTSTKDRVIFHNVKQIRNLGNPSSLLWNVKTVVKFAILTFGLP